MGISVGSADAVPILDARELTELAFKGPHYFDEALRRIKIHRRAQEPPVRDLFAFQTGSVASHERQAVPAFSHHLFVLPSVPGGMDLNFGGTRAQGSAWPGTACLLPAQLPSEWRISDGVGRSINLFLSPSILANVAAEALEIDTANAQLHPLFLFEDALILQVGTITEKLKRSSDLCDRLYLQSLSHTLAIHLLEHYVDFPARARPVKGRLPLTVLRQVADYVEGQPDCELTLAKLAALARLSPYHFARLFKDTTGQTVHAYVRERRLLHACYLLRATRLPIAFIATETGFADESHFVRSFKARFGVTPGIVRRSILQ